MPSTDRWGRLVVRGGGGGGHGYFGPAVDVCEAGRIDVGVRMEGWVEGDETGAVRIVDMAEVVETEVVDEIATYERDVGY